MAREKVIRRGLKILGSLGSGTGDPLLTLDSTSKEVGSISSIDLSAYLTNSLASARIYVGNSSDIATAVAMSGAITITNAGVTSIVPDIITNTNISSVAAIAYSKLNLSGSIVNGDIASNAAISRAKLAVGNTYRIAVNNNLGELTDANAITPNRLIISDANGLPSASSITDTVAGYLDPTSSVQTQLNNRLSFSSAITPAEGDILYYTGGAWTNLGAGSDGDVLTLTSGLPVWDSIAATGTLPTGGTANQYLKKVDGTDYNTTWDTLALSDITDVTANITQVNALATGFYDATSSVQDQLDDKLDSALTTDNIWVGVGGVATEGTNLPTGITIGSQYIYRTGGTDVTIADGGTGSSLTDPGADRILFWDDSAGAVTWLQPDANFAITGTSLGVGTTFTVANGANSIVLTPSATSSITLTNSSGSRAFGLQSGGNNLIWFGAASLNSSGLKLTTSQSLDSNAPNFTRVSGTSGSGGVLYQADLTTANSTAWQAITTANLGAGTTQTVFYQWQGSWVSSNANQTVQVIRTVPTINQTSSSTGAVIIFDNTPVYTSVQGDLTFFDYNPTETSITGAHYGLRIRSATTLNSIGLATPTAVLDIGASTTARASLRIRSGTAPTSPNDGDIWNDGTDLFVRLGGVTYTIQKA